MCQQNADDPLFTGVSWKRLLDTAIERSRDLWAGARDLLARTPLLAPEERLASFLEQPEFWADAQAQADYQLALGWLARWALKDGAGSFDEAQKSSLVGLVEKAAPHVTVSNMPLTWGLRLDPARLGEAALAWFETKPALPQTHYLLVAWLDSGLDPARAERTVELWLRARSEISQASFLVRAWLDAGGDKGLVEQPIRNWLRLHQAAPEATHVYQAWLAAGGDKGLVEQPIRNWLRLHETAREATHVYQAWLAAGGDKGLVEQPIRNWLRLHETAREATHVYQAWLDAGGDKGLVEQPIRNWLRLHQTAREATHVYQAWLAAGGAKGLVEQPIRNWLRLHQTAPEATHVYQAWLAAGGDTDFVEQPIRNWLRLHQTAPEATHVYKPWLDAGGDKGFVEQPVRNWLRLHQTAREATHVYQAWLAAGGDKGLVEQPIHNWLDHHQAAPEARFVYTAWLDAGGDSPVVTNAAYRWMGTNWHRQDAGFLAKHLATSDVLPISTVKDALRWCCRFPKDEDAIWRLTSLFRHLGPADLDLPFIATTLVVLGAQLPLDAEPSSELALQLRTLFLNIGGIGLASASLRPACDMLQQLIFRDERTFATTDDLPFVRNQFMIDLVLTLIRVGHLKLGDSADRAAFRRFVSWLATWNDGRKAWARAVIELNQDVVGDLDLRQELIDAVQSGTPAVDAEPSAAA